jgi:sugar-specific transcriptional regulator TrmB
MQTTVEALNSLGLTVYEAKTYIALLQKHPANGNELSRRSGVPGPKIYETLNNMVQKGLVAVLNANPQMFLRFRTRSFWPEKGRSSLLPNGY